MSLTLLRKKAEAPPRKAPANAVEPVKRTSLATTEMRWGEIVGQYGLNTLQTAMRQAGADNQKVEAIAREREAKNVRKMDPFDRVEEWLRNQLRDINVCRGILASTVQTLQSIRSGTPNLSGEPLEVLPGKAECKQMPEWTTAGGKPAAVWTDRHGVHWAALPNPLSLEAERQLREAADGKPVWLVVMSRDLQQSCPDGKDNQLEDNDSAAPAGVAL